MDPLHSSDKFSQHVASPRDMLTMKFKKPTTNNHD